ncbi:hypothetical protein CAPN008_01140 [Capnocytophaga canis]|uniref:hypothetical protein n=1 Tax=Capnocytophaga canis TaxID=1848903 RepID=UPI001AC9E38B|nr:hypothetical protein [Capnocytophaga canis]GIM60064.1 hypothetical protein CAPN008_01140 [Capnocytophaga canis]
MTERNVLNGTVAVFLSDFVTFFYPLKWFTLLALFITFADLRFGVLAAKKRGEVVRFSRAIRRTINKLVDYACWLFLAGAFGQAFDHLFNEKILPSLIMLVIFGVEINSCFSNYFEYHGRRIKVNIFNFFGKKTDIIELEENEENNESDVQKNN